MVVLVRSGLLSDCGCVVTSSFPISTVFIFCVCVVVRHQLETVVSDLPRFHMDVRRWLEGDAQFSFFNWKKRLPVTGMMLVCTCCSLCFLCLFSIHLLFLSGHHGMSAYLPTVLSHPVSFCRQQSDYYLLLIQISSFTFACLMNNSHSVCHD